MPLSTLPPTFNGQTLFIGDRLRPTSWHHDLEMQEYVIKGDEFGLYIEGKFGKLYLPNGEISGFALTEPRPRDFSWMHYDS